MIFDIFRKHKKEEKKDELITDQNDKPILAARYVFNEKATVKTYAMTIAQAEILNAVRKKYSAPDETKNTTKQKPKSTFDAELATYEARHKTSNLKITLNADPTEENGGFHKIQHGEDFDMRYFENKNFMDTLLHKLGKEKPDYETLIRLFYHKGLSHQEIADSCKTAYRTAESTKSHTSRAIKMLKELAQKEGLFNHLDKQKSEK